MPVEPPNQQAPEGADLPADRPDPAVAEASDATADRPNSAVAEASDATADRPDPAVAEASDAAADRPDRPAAGAPPPPAEPDPERAQTPSAPQDGPAHFRQLTRSTESEPSNEELLEQVPEELREVLAERMQVAGRSDSKSFREDTVESLKARGYQVTEDARGSRLTSGGGRTSDLSPYDTVRLAAEQEGGVQPQGNLPICPECQAASPAGSERCQWCGAELPQD